MLPWIVYYHILWLYSVTNIILYMSVPSGRFGQRAFVGKVNMDTQSPDFIVEDTRQSLLDTRE